MEIRKAIPNDLDAILELFSSTIQHINKADYSAEQLAAWGAAANEKERWLEIINSQYFLVAVKDSQITGFSSITALGYLDTLFVDKNHQREGIAKLLLEKLVDFACESKLTEITTDGSITARPFFEKHGFEVIKKQEVNRKGIEIVNFKMVKVLF